MRRDIFSFDRNKQPNFIVSFIGFALRSSLFCHNISLIFAAGAHCRPVQFGHFIQRVCIFLHFTSNICWIVSLFFGVCLFVQAFFVQWRVGFNEIKWRCLFVCRKLQATMVFAHFAQMCIEWTNAEKTALLLNFHVHARSNKNNEGQKTNWIVDITSRLLSNESCSQHLLGNPYLL